MLQIAIIEDEERYAQELDAFIRRYAEETSRQIRITHYRDGEDLIEDYSGRFDILLMDIQMQFMDGMTAAEKIRERDQQVQIIFITNRNDYAIRGYEVDALDYVLKPVSYFIFAQKLNKAMSRIEGRTGASLAISTKNGVRRIRTEELYYVESDAHNLIYHTKNGEFVTRGRLRDAEKNLEGKGFFRSNKCYLVNLQCVDGISDGCCEIGGEKLLISRARRSDFMAALTKQIGG